MTPRRRAGKFLGSNGEHEPWLRAGRKDRHQHSRGALRGDLLERRRPEPLQRGTDRGRQIYGHPLEG